MKQESFSISEFLPALMPRFYSICRLKNETIFLSSFDDQKRNFCFLFDFSSPLDDSRSLSFVFSLMKFEKNLARTYERFGLCTNWLRTIDLGSEVCSWKNVSSSSFRHSTFLQVFIQTRISQHFRLPSTLDTPLIMIGPGTGVAPFIGFLDHL